MKMPDPRRRRPHADRGRRHDRRGMTRRSFLRGVGGVTLALPFLETFATKEALAAEGRPTYSVFMRQGNGVAQASGDEPERC